MSNEVKTKEKIDMDPKYIVKLTVTLLGTCLIVALLLGLVNGVTAGPIAEINQQKTEAAMLAVVSDPDNTHLLRRAGTVWRHDRCGHSCRRHPERDVRGPGERRGRPAMP